ncbi:MAG: glucose 1-dehydrogenase [Peptococcaceae bacterium]|jgi:3-oxoacyl-[acyl-carrier protein] reductase|nr:glucose 1-dehydrogenase [Peptococcaceae bacterium]
MKRLAGKTVIVTGATSGIGEAQAVIMAREGAKIICVGQNKERMERVLNKISQEGGEATGCLASVQNEADCKRAAALAIEKYGRIDSLCNTAGIFDGFKKSLDQTEEGWMKLFDVDVKGVFLMTNAVLPNMLANKNGSIINVTSIAGLTGGAGGAAYTAAKHAVNGYTKQLCVDYAMHGIRANAIAAGTVATAILKKIIEDDPHEKTKMYETIPSKNIGQPEDIAYLTVFLASDEARWIHGAIISADGGRQALG